MVDDIKDDKGEESAEEKENEQIPNEDTQKSSVNKPSTGCVWENSFSRNVRCQKKNVAK